MLHGLLSKSEPCLKPAYPTQQLNCPHCEAPFEASRRAVTLRCPSCAKPLQFQDAVYDRATIENVTTLGQVRINRKGALRGRVDCASLHVQGQLTGDVRVRGEARVGAKAAVSGTLTVCRLVIDAGGRFRGTLHVKPAQASSEDS